MRQITKEKEDCRPKKLQRKTGLKAAFVSLTWKRFEHISVLNMLESLKDGEPKSASRKRVIDGASSQETGV